MKKSLNQQRATPPPTSDGFAAAMMARTDLNVTSDEALGQRLLAARLAAEAERHGIFPGAIPAQLAEAWMRQLQTQEADSVTNIPLEKAINLAAKGEFEKAGRTLRAWTLDMGQRLADTPRAAADRAREAKAKAAGAKGGSKSKPGKLQNIKEEFAALVAGGRSERDARSVLVQRHGVTPQGLGKALRKAAK